MKTKKGQWGSRHPSGRNLLLIPGILPNYSWMQIKVRGFVFQIKLVVGLLQK